MSEKAQIETKSANIESAKHNTDGDDFPSMVKHLLYNVNWKLGIIVFILGFILFSNLFVDNVISKFPNTIDAGIVNTKGSIIQLILYVIILLTVDIMIRGNML
jgi:hypothetical protein